MLQFQQHLFCTFFGEMTSWPVQYDIIYHFSIFEDLRGWQPCVEGHFVFKDLGDQHGEWAWCFENFGTGFPCSFRSRFPCLRSDAAVHVNAIFFINHPLTFSARLEWFSFLGFSFCCHCRIIFFGCSCWFLSFFSLTLTLKWELCLPLQARNFFLLIPPKKN